MKKIVYVDMDGVLVDLVGYIHHTFYKDQIKDLGVGGIIDTYDFIFTNASPVPGAIEAFKKLAASPEYDVYILSTAPWNNEMSWTYKRKWVGKHLGEAAKKRLILSHHKNLMIGDYLIDDRTHNGAGDFQGELIQFGQDKFKDWDAVLKYLSL